MTHAKFSRVNSMLAAALAVTSYAAATSCASADDYRRQVRPHHVGVYGLNGGCEPDTAKRMNVLSDHIEIIRPGYPTHMMYFDGFCRVDCAIEAPSNPSTSFTASLIEDKRLSGGVVNPLDSTSLAFFEAGPGVISLRNDSSANYKGHSASKVQSLYDRPFKRCASRQVERSRSNDVKNEEPRPIWRAVGNPRVAVYGHPETTPMVKLQCIGPGKMEISVPAPSEGFRKIKTRSAGYIVGQDYSMTTFQVRDGDGDVLVFPASPTSAPVAQLMKNGVFQIGLPTNEMILVDGAGASSAVMHVAAQCPSKKTDQQLRSIPAAGSSNVGWWVVLAKGPGTPDRATNGGAIVDRSAAKCGIRSFNDFTDKFPGFEPGHNLHVLLGSPFGSKAVADNALKLATPCFPMAYVKHGSYLGE